MEKEGLGQKIFLTILGSLISALLGLVLHYELEDHRTATSGSPSIVKDVKPDNPPKIRKRFTASSQATVPPEAVLEKPVLHLTVSAKHLQPGQSAQIRWVSDNCNQVRVQGDGIDKTLGPSDLAVVKPPLGKSTYVVTADGPGGSTSEPVAFEVVDSGMRFGALAWEGTVLGTDQITISGGATSAGKIVSGELPGVPCQITAEDASVSPAFDDDCSKLVFRVVGNGTVRVVFRWTKTSSPN